MHHMIQFNRLRIPVFPQAKNTHVIRVHCAKTRRRRRSKRKKKKQQQQVSQIHHYKCRRGQLDNYSPQENLYMV
jgi:hypothetical protein